ncbi:MAG: dTMP kinase [bacterium]
MPRGIFITIEGPEGAGKTTQARLLDEYLRPRYPVLHTREPGGTTIGEQIRTLLLDEDFREMAPQAEMLLFAAARAQFVSEVVEPALREGRLVLSERYVDASVAYQGYARGLGVDVVRQVNSVATGGLLPDLTLLIDIDAQAGLERARVAEGKQGRRGRGDRLEQEALPFHVRVREGFLAIAREQPNRVQVIDGTGAQQVVHGEIVRRVEHFLISRGWRVSSSS